MQGCERDFPVGSCLAYHRRLDATIRALWMCVFHRPKIAGAPPYLTWQDFPWLGARRAVWELGYIFCRHPSILDSVNLTTLRLTTPGLPHPAPKDANSRGYPTWRPRSPTPGLAPAGNRGAQPLGLPHLATKESNPWGCPTWHLRISTPGHISSPK